MKLQYKALIIFCFMWAIILFALLVDSQIILRQSYNKLENRLMLNDVSTVANELSKSLQSLKMYTLAWAQWDDAYQFMNNKNSKFISTNYVPGTFSSSKINFFFFFNNEGKLYYGKAYDFNKKEMTAPPKGLINYLENQKTFVIHDEPQSSKAGIMRAPKGLVVLASLPVIKADGSGPVNGALLMGYYLNETIFSDIGKEVGAEVMFHPLPLTTPNSMLVKADAALKNSKENYITNADEDFAKGFFYLRDVDGTPVGLVEITMPRDIYRQGIATTNHYLLILLMVGVFAAGVIWFLLKHYVLDRIIDVGEQVMKINERGDFKGRITISGNDEINTLAVYINKMIGLISVSQKKLNYMVHHDSLTGLPNRLLFHTYFSDRIVNQRYKDKKLAVLFLDINGFKSINDKYGHAFGDQVLQHVAQCLIACVRKADIVCRLSGDEFAVCYHEFKKREEINSLINNIKNKINTQVEIDGFKIKVSMSAGISIYPDNATDIKNLLKLADHAMYLAKNDKNNFYYYCDEVKHEDEMPV